MKHKKILASLTIGASLLLGACANNAQSNNSNTTKVEASSKNSKLGPVVGKIAGKPIRANQLLRKSNWNGGYGTPSNGKDTNRDHKPVRRLTKK